MQGVLLFLSLLVVAIVIASGADTAGSPVLQSYLRPFPAAPFFNNTSAEILMLETKIEQATKLANAHWKARHGRRQPVTAVAVLNVLLMASVVSFIVLRCFAALNARQRWSSAIRTLAERGRDGDNCSWRLAVVLARKLLVCAIPGSGAVAWAWHSLFCVHGAPVVPSLLIFPLAAVHHGRGGGQEVCVTLGRARVKPHRCFFVSESACTVGEFLPIQEVNQFDALSFRRCVVVLRQHDDYSMSNGNMRMGRVLLHLMLHLRSGGGVWEPRFIGVVTVWGAAVLHYPQRNVGVGMAAIDMAVIDVLLNCAVEFHVAAGCGGEGEEEQGYLQPQLKNAWMLVTEHRQDGVERLCVAIKQVEERHGTVGSLRDVGGLVCLWSFAAFCNVVNVKHYSGRCAVGHCITRGFDHGDDCPRYCKSPRSMMAPDASEKPNEWVGVLEGCGWLVWPPDYCIIVMSIFVLLGSVNGVCARVMVLFLYGFVIAYWHDYVLLAESLCVKRGGSILMRQIICAARLGMQLCTCEGFAIRVGWCGRVVWVWVVDAAGSLRYDCYAGFCSATEHEWGMSMPAAWQRSVLDVCEMELPVCDYVRLWGNSTGGGEYEGGLGSRCAK
ncbi:hypothetical protein EMWEY_00047090 [Eimeria maxima]|uniref:Uncharacterized protein n=1 Tax=Eimeria maxima TaxID=5804 RepID=U6M2R5_EIMMA|nr:hypothetical protein EMWEY_00047090 [Eimeria maxima]CDJ55980.1 hypothetical protein EMWEY_00047090 [Eimeria maxima]